MDEDRATWRAADMHAAKACAKALGTTPRELKILKHDTVEGRYDIQIHMPAGIIDGRREFANGGFNPQTKPNEIYSKEQVKRPFKQVTVLCQS